jgi:hypothetical protein
MTQDDQNGQDGEDNQNGQNGQNGQPGDPTTGSYARDIQPKFRPSDISCMARRHVMLDQATWMCDPAASFGFDDHGNARKVFAMLSAQRMPPDGPWPQDWLDTYQNWIDTGFQP